MSSAAWQINKFGFISGLHLRMLFGLFIVCCCQEILQQYGDNHLATDINSNAVLHSRRAREKSQENQQSKILRLEKCE